MSPSFPGSPDSLLKQQGSITALTVGSVRVPSKEDIELD